MPAPWMVRAALSGAVVLTAVVMFVWARGLRREDPALWPGILIVVLGALIWVPPVVRDPGLALLLAVAAAGIADSNTVKLVGAVGVGAAVLLLASVVPGGASSIILLPIVLGVVLVTYSDVEHLLRLRRARALRPNERPRGELAVGGKAPARSVAPPSGVEAETAAWQVSWSDDAQEHRFDASPTLLTIEGQHGQVLVDLESVRLTIESGQQAAVEAEQGLAIAEALGSDRPAAAPPPEGSDPPSPAASPEAAVTAGEARPATESKAKARTGLVSWLTPGQEVFVVGVPKWEAGHGAVGYRDAPVVPVFRGTGEHPAWLADHAEAEATTRAHWSVTQGITWGLICAIITVAQLLGLA